MAEAKKATKKGDLGATVQMRQDLPPAAPGPNPSQEIDPAKACQILKDGQVNGQPLTMAQKRLMMAACSQMQQGQGAAAGAPPMMAADGAIIHKYLPYLLDAAVEPGFASVLEAVSVG